MNRIKYFHEGISKRDLILEIGPYVNPLFPKRDGWNVMSNDILNYDDLLKKAQNDSNLDHLAISRIEPVDFVGETTKVFNTNQNFDGKVDCIISSHNLEHIPNPIKFLKTCQKLLKKNGNLILALPDYRCCWDRFRPLTSCADWIQSYHEDSDKPSAKQIFLQNSMHCRWNDNGILRATMPLGTELCELIPLETLEKAYQKYISNINKGDSMEYTDTHCWTFTPESFQLILLDLFFLKLINFFPINVNSGENSEFLIKLEKRTEMGLSKKKFYRKRKKLFYAIASYHSDQL